MAQIGRIGGPLLEEDLIRNGVDIAFRNTLSTTQLLYIDVNNRRIGVNLNNPSYELEIFGTTRTIDLITDDLVLPNLRIEDNEINAVVGNIVLDAADAIVLSNLETSEITISDNRINTIRSNANIDLIPNGTGTVETDNLRIFGNLTTPGTITLGGTITFGNNTLEDTVDFNTDVSSDIIPDQTFTYRLGNASKRWNEIYTDLVNGEVIDAGSIGIGGVDFGLRAGNIFYVSVNGNDANSGDHPQAPFVTISRALDAADASNGGPVTIFVYPGEYQEQLPLVVPSNVSVIGEGIRSVTVLPAAGYETEDVFHLNGETTVQHLTVKDFYYDNINNTGHAFRFAPNAVITSRSPYVQNVSVITNTELLTPVQITVGPSPTGVSLTSNSVTLSKTFYSQALVDSLVGQIAVIDRYPAAPLFYTVVSIETEPLSPTEWRMTVDSTFNAAGQIKPISFYPDVELTQIITTDIWDTSGSSVGENWVAYFKTNLPLNFETIVEPGWTINVAGTIYIVDYIIQDPINSNQWRIYVTTTLIGGVGIPIFSSPTPASYYATYISHDRLTTSALEINDNFIRANVTNGNVIFDPNGTGVINLQKSVVNTGGVDVTGNINIQGNLSYGGSLILGDAAADALDFNGEFNKALLPGVDGYYNLGAPGKSWALLQVANAEIGSLSQNSILVDNKLYIANSANDITATQGNDPIYVNPDTRVIYLEDLKIENNIITNQLNTPLTITSTGTGYVQFTDTNAFIIPVGDNSQRGFTEVGETRWNTEVGYMECFDGSVYYVATGPGEFLTPEDMQELGNVYSIILG